MGGCASSKPKVKDEDREPYGSSATSKSDSRQKSGAARDGDKTKSKQPQSGASSSSRDPVAPSGVQTADSAIVPSQQQRQQSAPGGKPEAVSAEVQQEVKEADRRSGTTAPAAAAVNVAKNSTENSEIRPQVQQQARPAEASPTHETGSAPSAPSASKSPPVAPAVTAPVTVSIGSEQGSKYALPERASKTDGANVDSVGTKPVAVDVSQVGVRISATGKEAAKSPQQPSTSSSPTAVAQVSQPTRAPTNDVSRTTLAVSGSAREQPGAVPSGRVGEVVAKSDANRTSAITSLCSPDGTGELAGTARRLSSAGEEKRMKFAGSAMKQAVVETVATLSETTEKRSMDVDVDGERVDIKSVDPKMEIFDALNKSGQQNNAAVVDAAVRKGQTTDETKATPAVAHVTASGVNATGLQPGNVLINGQAERKEESTASKSAITDDQKTVASGQVVTVVKSTSAEPVAVTGSLTQQKDAPASSPDQISSSVNSRAAAAAEGQGQTTAISTSVTVSTSSLPRPTSAVSGLKLEPSSPPSSVQTSKPQDETSKAETKSEKLNDQPTTIAKKDEAAPSTKLPSTERTSKLPTFSTPGSPTSLQHHVSLTSPTASQSSSNHAVSPGAAGTSTPSRSTSAASPVSTDQSSKTVAAVSDSSVDLDKIKELLIDLSAGSRSIISGHQLAPKTRVKVLQIVDQWLTGTGHGDGAPPATANGTTGSTETGAVSKSRVLVITGRHGAGKTCLAAELYRRYSGRNQLIGCHFFDRRSTNVDHNRTAAVLLSLAHQLVDSQFGGYVRSLPSYARLSEAVTGNDVADLFTLLVGQPLRSANVTNARSSMPAADQKRQVLLVDGLDECDPADRDHLCRLVNEFDASTPDWLHLVATVRAEDQLVTNLAADRIKTVELRADVTDAECMGDIKRYLRDSMSKYIDRISLDGALAQLAKNAEGNFLCAKLLKNRLDELPPNTKLALRDISLTFPVGLGDICRQTFQTLHDRLGAATDKNRNKNRPTAYATVTSLLAVASEPLHRSAFGVENEEAVVECTSGGVLTLSGDGMVGLCHDAVVEWLLSEKTPAPLGVNLSNARQAMADAVIGWLSPVLTEDGGSDENSSPAPGDIHRNLTEYAVKHAIRHLTDVGKQQENIAKTLCSLRFVEYKLKIPGVRLSHLLEDYSHCHIQANPGSGLKLVTLEAYMKRNPELVEQISLMHRFVVRRGPCIVSVGAELALHVAANYPTAARIQHNARLDLGNGPWFEDLTAVADTKSISRQLSGTIVDVDLSNDQRLVALVTTSDASLSPQPLLYVFNATTMEPVNPDPTDLCTILPDSTKCGLCVRFIPAGTTPSVFVGSLTQFVSVRGGRTIDSGFDLSSVKLSERYSIECCAVGGSLLACAANTLPFNGRSLHIILFDVQTKKCTRTVEVLKFRFGGSAQYGIKACALSADGSLLSACVKQTAKPELKVTVWSTAKGDTIASVDVDDDSLSKCCLFTGEQPAVLITSGVRGQADKDRKNGGSSMHSYVWSYQEKTAKPVRVERRSEKSLGHAVGQIALWAQWRGSSAPSEVVLSLFKRGAVASGHGGVQPDRKFAVYGFDDIFEVVALEKSVLFLTRSGIHLMQYQNLQAIDSAPQSPGGSIGFAAAEARIECVSFAPRSDDPLVSYWSFPSRDGQEDEQTGLSATLISAKSDGIAVVKKVFDHEPQPIAISTDSSSKRIFLAPETVAYSADGSTALMRCRDAIHAVDLSAGTRRILPRYSDLTGNSSVDVIKLCVVSPKDSLVGVVYDQSPQQIYLFDVKTPQSGRPLQQLRLQSETDSDTSPSRIADFSFLPANGHVIACFRKSDAECKGEDADTLAVWHQRTGVIVSCESGLSVGFVRASPASDRLILVTRTPGGSPTAGSATDGRLILRNNDNRFSKSLETPIAWSSDSNSTDLEFSIDGTVLIGVGGGQCRVWNAGNGETLRTFAGVNALEIVGMPTNAHVLLHDPSGERLLLVDVTSGLEKPPVVAAVSTDGRLCRKWTERRLRISPRGGAVVGSTEDRELRLYACRNMASVKRQTTLQIMKSQTAVK